MVAVYQGHVLRWQALRAVDKALQIVRINQPVGFGGGFDQLFGNPQKLLQGAGFRLGQGRNREGQGATVTGAVADSHVNSSAFRIHQWCQKRSEERRVGTAARGGTGEVYG